MKTNHKPAGNSFPVLRQICNLIPRSMFDELCERYGFDTRGFSEWSHFVAMLYAHLSRASSLHEVCDGLKMHAAALACVKGATPPSKSVQADRTTRRFSRQQRQRRALANMGGPARPPAPSVLRMAVFMGARLLPYRGGRPIGALATLGPARAAARLWESTARFRHGYGPETGRFRGILLNQWDSRTQEHTKTRTLTIRP